ncbi:MAG: DUF167 domain-containing protein [Nitrospinota bacterium]
MIPVRREAEGASFEVEVQPRASRTAVEGARGGALRVRLTAPPVEGAANRQCIELLSKVLGVPKSAVSILSGAAGKRKRLLVRGVEPSAAEAALARLARKGAERSRRGGGAQG